MSSDSNSLPLGIALGSNLGDSHALMSEAWRFLKDLPETAPPYRQGKLYRSSPVDCPPDSPDFLNSAVEVQFAGDLSLFFQKLQTFELRQGRTEDREKNSPRPIDLDLLYLANERLATKQLTLPHPRLEERLFVIQPLNDIRPDYLLPNGKPVSEVCAQLLSTQGSLEVLSDTW